MGGDPGSWGQGTRKENKLLWLSSEMMASVPCKGWKGQKLRGTQM